MMIDNQPGKSALQKSFGKDQRENLIIAAFWSLASREELFPALQYVRSELNISDPISRHETAEADRSGWTRMEIDTRAAGGFGIIRAGSQWLHQWLALDPAEGKQSESAAGSACTVDTCHVALLCVGTWVE